MSIDDVTFALLDAMEAAGCDYLLVGAIAAIYYGITRSTFDVHVVAYMDAGQVSDVAARLGPNYRLESQQAFEVFTGKTMHVIQVAETPFKIDLFPLTS